MNNEQAILDDVNADHWRVLYRCRWSPPDAARVVPQLIGLLDSQNADVAQEALRALHRIGTPAAAAAQPVAELTRSLDPITKRLAVLTLGQFACTRPDVCIEPLASALDDPNCCRDALRALAYLGSKASAALPRVRQRFASPHAKTRKSVIVTAAAINVSDSDSLELFRRALSDRSRMVREAAKKSLRNHRED